MKSSITSNLLRQAQANNIMSMLRDYGVFTGDPGRAGTINKGWEIITQPMRDYQTYPTTGFRQLSFMQSAVGSAGTTQANQNMPGAGQFPRGQMYLWEGLEVDFKPAGNPVQVGQTEAAATELTNDLWNVTRAGFLTVTISTRPYLNVGPLSQFPPSYRTAGDFALSDTSTAAASQRSTMELSYNQGEPFQFIPYLIPEVTNFIIALNYDAPVTITTAGLIGVNMNGCLIRRNQ